MPFSIFSIMQFGSRNSMDGKLPILSGDPTELLMSLLQFPVTVRLDPDFLSFPDRTVRIVISRIRCTSGPVHCTQDQPLLALRMPDRLSTFRKVFQSNIVVGCVCNSLGSDITPYDTIGTGMFHTAILCNIMNYHPPENPPPDENPPPNPDPNDES